MMYIYNNIWACKSKSLKREETSATCVSVDDLKVESMNVFPQLKMCIELYSNSFRE